MNEQLARRRDRSLAVSGRSDLSQHILSLLCQLAGEARIALLCSLHQHDLAVRYFDRVLLLQDGVLSEYAGPAVQFATAS